MRFKVLTSWYLRYERLISSFSLIGGFIFDIFALKRIDLFWENLWVGAHLAVATLGIILINLNENYKEKISPRAYRIIHFWLIIAIQFAFGGLLSTFLVFYFRSGTLSASWPFLSMLAIVFVLNELLKHRYTQLVFQTSVLFISIYSFAIFIVPVILHQIGPGTFILSGAVSLVIIALIVYCLRFISRERFLKSKWLLFASIASITILVNVLYFTNLIPPIPLSLKDAGVYHSVARTAVGNYTAVGEPQGFWDYFKSYEPFHEIKGQPVYAYSSIFSPTNLNTEVVHEWQHFDDATKKWITTAQIQLSIIGGRDGGFRTYSTGTVDSPGLWRINVMTLRGQLIGRIKFDLETVDAIPNLAISTL
jgi:hypothetical protein